MKNEISYYPSYTLNPFSFLLLIYFIKFKIEISYIKQKKKKKKLTYNF